jgi:hypothetical protein
MITPKDYQSAIQVQSACNLRAILRSMADIADRSDGCFGHPVLRMYAEQVMFLTGGMGDQASYNRAYDIVTCHRTNPVTVTTSLTEGEQA